MSTVLKVTHNAGFFSCCAIRLKDIINFYKENSILPIVDSSEQFNFYKNIEGDISNLFFENNNSDFNLTDMDYPEQFQDYSLIDFENINLLIDKYFKPSDIINQISEDLIIKYGINPARTIAICFRGNDKQKETNLPSHQDMIEKLTGIKNKFPDYSILVQSDEIEFYEEVIKKFPDIIFFQEIIKINKNNNLAIQYVVPPEHRLNQALLFLAITLILSKCNKLIINSGNVGLFITLYRGNCNGVYQYLNHKEYIYGDYNPHHANQTKFWYDND
jgi:hypothetical protein